MNIDLLGQWHGTYQTDGLWYTPGLFSESGQYVGGQGFGGPAQNSQVTLDIEWQGAYQNLSQGVIASPFYGTLLGAQQSVIPVSGFLNQEGYIKMAFYFDETPQPPNVEQTTMDGTFNSFIQTQGGIHTMAGGWEMTSWSQGILTYSLGTLNVQRAVSLKERLELSFDAARQNISRIEP